MYESKRKLLILLHIVVWTATVNSQASLGTLGAGLLQPNSKSNAIVLDFPSSHSDASGSSIYGLISTQNQDFLGLGHLSGANSPILANSQFDSLSVLNGESIDEIAAKFGHVIPSNVQHPGFPPSLTSPDELGSSPVPESASNFYNIHRNSPSPHSLDTTSFTAPISSDSFTSLSHGIDLKSIQDTAVSDALSIIQSHISPSDPAKVDDSVSRPDLPKQNTLNSITSVFKYSDQQIAKVSLPPVFPSPSLQTETETEDKDPKSNDERFKFSTATESTTGAPEQTPPSRPYPNVLPPPPSRPTVKLPERLSYSPYETPSRKNYDRQVPDVERFRQGPAERFEPSDGRLHPPQHLGRSLPQRNHRQPNLPPRPKINHRNPNFSFGGFRNGPPIRGEN